MQLKADELTCSRGGREVFRGLSFSLSAGEAMVVTGRNGAGKSSLLRMIAGLVRIAAGRLALDSNNADTPIAEQAHYLGHQDAMKPSLSVRENLQFWTEFLGAHRAVEPALDLEPQPREIPLQVAIPSDGLVREPVDLVDAEDAAAQRADDGAAALGAKIECQVGAGHQGAVRVQ